MEGEENKAHSTNGDCRGFGHDHTEVFVLADQSRSARRDSQIPFQSPGNVTCANGTGGIIQRIIGNSIQARTGIGEIINLLTVIACNCGNRL